MSQVTPRKAVVLVSGGMDSAVTIAIAREQGYQVHALSVAYGQRHSAELAASERVSHLLGAVEHKTVQVDLRTIGGSALTADIDVPLDQAGEQGIPVTYVPARNTIMLSIALGWFAFKRYGINASAPIPRSKCWPGRQDQPRTGTAT